jgi:hypothetical protein
MRMDIKRFYFSYHNDKYRGQNFRFLDDGPPDCLPEINRLYLINAYTFYTFSPYIHCKTDETHWSELAFIYNLQCTISAFPFVYVLNNIATSWD